MSHAPNSLVRRARTATAVLALTTIAAGTMGAEAASAGTIGSSRAEVRSEVLASVNQVRAQHGCKPLKVGKGLAKAAQRHADDMSVTGVFSHVSADGRTWGTRVRAAGWKKSGGGENIARGYDSAGEVMTAWMNSPGHRRNIVNCKFRYIGVGYTPVGQYWVQNFGY